MKTILLAGRVSGAIRGLALMLVVQLAAWSCAFGADLLATHDASGNFLSLAGQLNQAPTLLASPHSRVARPGGFASFSVSAKGSPALNYQWHFNGAPLPGAKGDSLLLTGISATHVGNYHVVVANAFGSVTSASARLELDTDGDGLPDVWEVANFGSLTNQTAFSDKDGDGTPNLIEFYDGTQPSNAVSVLPRLRVISLRGSVSISPDLEHYPSNQVVRLTATPDAGQTFLGWSGALSSNTPTADLVLKANTTVVANFGLPLAPALGVPDPVALRGNVLWYGQREVTHDGVSAARSGRIFHDQTSTLQLTNIMRKEGTISFWWKANSQRNRDFLSLWINGVVQPGAISGDTDWQRKTYYLTTGVQVVRWDFVKDNRDGSQFDGDFAQQGNTYDIDFFTAQDWVALDEVVWEEYNDPARDTDHDGLPDLWEWKWFYSLNETATGDTDSDGISNLDEFLEGTIPTRSGSLKPRLVVEIRGDGSVTRTPDKPKYDVNQTVNLNAVASPGSFFVGWSGDLYSTNPAAPLILGANRKVRATFGSAVAPAVDAPALNCRSGGTRVWFGQTAVSHDGISAAQSGPLRAGDDSWIETDFTGPGTLTFWWKISTTAGIGGDVRLFANGVQQPIRLQGPADWQPQVYFLGAGSTTIRWRYQQGSLSTTLENAAWLDQVKFTPGVTAPDFLQQPANLNAFQGLSATFQVLTLGTPPVQYELLRNGVPTGVTSANGTLVLPAVTPAMSGTYSVRASNSAGVRVSDPMRLAVLPVPPVNDAFANATVITSLNEPVSGYSVGATSEPGEPGTPALTHTVWWRWVAPQSGKFRVIADSRDDRAGLKLVIYRGSSLTQLVEESRAVGATDLIDEVYLARVSSVFDATAGTPYSLVLDTGFQESPSLTILLQAEAPPERALDASFSILDGFQFTLSAPPGMNYTIDRSEDLMVWETIVKAKVPADGIIRFSDPSVGDWPGGYYRIRVGP